MDLSNIQNKLISTDRYKVIGAGAIATTAIGAPFVPFQTIPILLGFGGCLTKVAVEHLQHQIFHGCPDLQIPDPKGIAAASLLSTLKEEQRKEFILQVNQLKIPDENRLEAARILVKIDPQERVLFSDQLNQLPTTNQQRFEFLKILSEQPNRESLLTQLYKLQMPDSDRLQALPLLIQSNPQERKNLCAQVNMLASINTDPLQALNSFVSGSAQEKELFRQKLDDHFLEHLFVQTQLKELDIQDFSGRIAATKLLKSIPPSQREPWSHQALQLLPHDATSDQKCQLLAWLTQIPATSRQKFVDEIRSLFSKTEENFYETVKTLQAAASMDKAKIGTHRKAPASSQENRLNIHSFCEMTKQVKEFKAEFMLEDAQNLQIIQAFSEIIDENKVFFLDLYRKALPPFPIEPQEKIAILTCLAKVPLSDREQALKAIKSSMSIQQRLATLSIFSKIPKEYRKEFLKKKESFFFFPNQKKQLDQNLLAISPTCFTTDIALVPVSLKKQMTGELISALYSPNCIQEIQTIFEKFPNSLEDHNLVSQFFENPIQGRKALNLLDTANALAEIQTLAKEWAEKNPPPNTPRFLLCVEAYFREFPRDA